MRVAAVVAWAALWSSGCAVFANTPPSARQSVAETPKCNTGKGAVVLDGLMATVFAVSALAVASDSGEAAGVLLLPTLAYGGSAAVGNRNADACRAAVAAHGEYLAGLQDDIERDSARARAARRGAERAAAAQAARGKAEAEAETEAEARPKSEPKVAPVEVEPRTATASAKRAGDGDGDGIGSGTGTGTGKSTGTGTGTGKSTGTGTGTGKSTGTGTGNSGTGNTGTARPAPPDDDQGRWDDFWRTP